MTATRRKLLKVAGGIAGAAVATAAGGFGMFRWMERERPLAYDMPDVPQGTLVATPGCGDLDATIAQTQGPFYTPQTPLRSNLREPGIKGAPFTVRGRILTTDCQPVAGAVLDVWSCDGEGVYDNDGYLLRGHQFTDENGEFVIETIKPSAYSGFGFFRAPHLHVKLQGPETELLTTQIYFPGEPENADDSIFDDSLLIDVQQDADGMLSGRFDFVLSKLA